MLSPTINLSQRIGGRKWARDPRISSLFSPVCRAALGNKKNARPRRFSETVIDLVPGTGLEPARHTTYAPKAYVSTSSTTRALKYYTKN